MLKNDDSTLKTKKYGNKNIIEPEKVINNYNY